MWGIDARDYFEDFFFWGLKWLCWSISGISKVKLFRLQHRMRYIQWGESERPTTTKKYNGWIEARKRKESESICCLQLLKVNCPLRISSSRRAVVQIVSNSNFFSFSFLSILFSLACRRCRLNKNPTKRKKKNPHSYFFRHFARQGNAKSVRKLFLREITAISW